MRDAFAVFLALLYLSLLEHLPLPVDVLLVEALRLLLRHVLAAFLAQVGTKSTLTTLLVLLLPAPRSEQLLPLLPQSLILHHHTNTSSYSLLKMLSPSPKLLSPFLLGMCSSELCNRSALF